MVHLKFICCPLHTFPYNKWYEGIVPQTELQRFNVQVVLLRLVFHPVRALAAWHPQMQIALISSLGSIQFQMRTA